MFILKDDRTLYVDCDDTLLIWAKDGHTFKPHKAHIELIKRFSKRNQSVIVWSQGGWKWALKVVKMLKLQKYVKLVSSKPSWFADDKKAEHFMSEDIRIYLKDVDDSSKTK